MSQTEAFVKGLQASIGKESFPTFWGNYPEKDSHTFKEALDKYAEYYRDLSSTQKDAISKVFWEQIKAIGTPIIEDSLDAGECEVYFLFPKNDLLVSAEKPGTKRDLYLQGDFHGYDTTDGRQKLEELDDTRIMHHIDTMPRDAIVNYRYIQLEPSLRGRNPIFDRPPFFGLSAKEEATRLINDLHKSLYEYSRILMSDEEPKIENMRIDDLIALKEDGQLTVYWIENGKIVNHSFSEDAVRSIVERLPAIGEESRDLNLIREVTSQYGCGQEYPPALYERYRKLLDEFEMLNRHENSDTAYQRFLDGDPKADPPRLGLSDLSITFCGLEGAPFWALEYQCTDQYSKHRASFLGKGPPVKETVFRVNENPELARLPGKEVVWSSLLSPPSPQNDQEMKFVYHNTFYSKLDGKLHLSDKNMKRDASNLDLNSNKTDSPYSDCTRAIHVFKPANGLIDNVVVVNDGMPYLSIGIMEEFEKMAEAEEGPLSPNTAFVFVTTLPGLEKTISQTNSRAKLQGLGGGRTVDYELQIDDYATFIRDKLFPGLNATGIVLPEDSSHRVMIGSSLSGTAAIYIGFKHPDLFGGIIAQSPSPSNKSCLKDLVASDNTQKSNVQLHLSCGLFEQPMYAAANANLMYAEELADKLNVKPLHIGANGHYFLAWTKALEQSLPETLNKMHKAQKDDTKSVGRSTTLVAKELRFIPDHKKKMAKDDAALQSNKKNNEAQGAESRVEKKRTTATDDFNITYGKRHGK
jgi:enterochelin esterase-like enzyme